MKYFRDFAKGSRLTIDSKKMTKDPRTKKKRSLTARLVESDTEMDMKYTKKLKMSKYKARNKKGTQSGITRKPKRGKVFNYRNIKSGTKK